MHGSFFVAYNIDFKYTLCVKLTIIVIYEGDMMNEWNDGYFTADTYTYGYYRELSPIFQKFCLLLKGFAAPESHDDDVHCELGYGQGVSINIHAASNIGKYYGTDFNPAHAAQANELCRASECDAQFFDDSFEQMLNRDDLPQFDSISLHGIWSWISTENQKIIVDFARKFLKPGGIFYNSYNCFPGWAPKSPLRELFILYDKFTAHNDTDTFKRVEDVLKFASDLLAANPNYLYAVPNLNAVLDSIKKSNHHYLAHEYLNRDWICMYFSDVADILSSAKLDYACSATPIDTIDKLNLRPDAIDFLNKIDNPVVREQSRDYFVNQQFRKDIYIRGARRLSDIERKQKLLNMNFVLMTTGNVEQKCKTPLGEVSFNNPNFEDILKYLSEDHYKPKKFINLVKQNPKISFVNLEHLIVTLSHMNIIMPCQEEANIAKVKETCQKLNDHLCKNAETSANIEFLASPVLGSGVPVPRFDQVFINALKIGEKTSDDLAQYAWQILESQGQRLMNQGKIVNDTDENIKMFKEMAQAFLDKKVPILKALQIL